MECLTLCSLAGASDTVARATSKLARQAIVLSQPAFVGVMIKALPASRAIPPRA
jgi:hypothetical protein